MKDPTNVTMLAALLAARGIKPLHATAFSEELHGIAKRLSSLAVADSNYGLTQRQESRVRNLREQASGLVDEYARWNEGKFDGLALSFGGDPRGYVVHVRGLPGNTWGGDESGFGVG